MGELVVSSTCVGVRSSVLRPQFSSLTVIFSCLFGSGFSNIFQQFRHFRRVLKSFSNYFSVF